VVGLGKNVVKSVIPYILSWKIQKVAMSEALLPVHNVQPRKGETDEALLARVRPHHINHQCRLAVARSRKVEHNTSSQPIHPLPGKYPLILDLSVMQLESDATIFDIDPFTIDGIVDSLMTAVEDEIFSRYGVSFGEVDRHRGIVMNLTRKMCYAMTVYNLFQSATPSQESTLHQYQ
jgi:hypothetical protein